MGSLADFVTFDAFDFDDSKKTEALLARRAAEKKRTEATAAAEKKRIDDAAAEDAEKIKVKQEALKKTKETSAARRGRRSTILTGRGIEDQLGVSRPEATETLG